MNKVITFSLLLVCCACEFESKELWYNVKLDYRFEQVDRLGQPHLDEILFGEAALTEIRAGDPSTDADDLAPLIEDAVTVLRESTENISGIPAVVVDQLSPAQVADQWTPNVVSIDVNSSIAIGSGNGRTLESDDSFDVIMQQTLGRQFTDGIGQLERNFVDLFPYLPAPRDLNCVENQPTEATDEEDATDGGISC